VPLDLTQELVSLVILCRCGPAITARLKSGLTLLLHPVYQLAYTVTLTRLRYFRFKFRCMYL